MDAGGWIFGRESALGYDEDGYERRERCTTVVECPECGEEVNLVAETRAWTEADDGRWNHSEYGPAIGECCGTLIGLVRGVDSEARGWENGTNLPA